MESRGGRRYRRVDEDAVVRAEGYSLWMLPLDALVGIAWILLSLVTGGLFFVAVVIMWIAGAERARQVLFQFLAGVVGLGVAFGVMALVIVLVSV